MKFKITLFSTALLLNAISLNVQAVPTKEYVSFINQSQKNGLIKKQVSLNWKIIIYQVSFTDCRGELGSQIWLI